MVGQAACADAAKADHDDTAVSQAAATLTLARSRPEAMPILGAKRNWTNVDQVREPKPSNEVDSAMCTPRSPCWRACQKN
eukprot:CAMPEP_0172573660 /NCGR_PEP_ID=MMETSP1067-20121228/136304_1 /TAXON_ID=265564 ORGANISM="Thalassiosira punctigera, Strain Tpunct2005C2" /NCGR_SAMPLE_ID=MMETSP1067 /ASSEMBLY_ACC=CAM_ASM_000444 /LENGTH=79 /DNA_ID=CAMNT_0013366267 /DNA_START=421 /DNA_END=661 /DNA_ORIENTATION=-